MRRVSPGFVAFMGVAVVALCQRQGGASQQENLPNAQQPAVKPAGQRNAQLALGLVHSAVEAAQNVDPASKAIVLLMAGRAVESLEPKKAVTYLRGSFAAVENVQGSNLRLALERRLVSEVADLDLDTAAELVERMDLPEITAHPDIDDRTATAGGIIRKLLARNSPDDPDRAVQLLEYLGDTGQFPYETASQAIGFFHGKGQDWRAVDVFTQAMGHFREDNRFQETPRKFAELLATSESDLPESVLVSALRLCTQTIQAAVARQNAPISGAERRRFGDAEEIITRLLMLADRLDPPSSSRLRELSVKLCNLHSRPSTSESEGGEFFRIAASEPAPQEPAENKLEIADATQALEAVRASVTQDPALALTRAEEIRIPEYQSLALALVGRHLSALEKATPVLEEAARAADQIDPAQQVSPEEWANKMAAKVQALAEIAEAWAQWGNHERASASLGKAFALAMELIQKRAALRPGAPSGFDDSAALLRRVAQVEAILDPSLAAERAQSVSDPRLRAYFLVSLAAAIVGKG